MKESFADVGKGDVFAYTFTDKVLDAEVYCIAYAHSTSRDTSIKYTDFYSSRGPLSNYTDIDVDEDTGELDDRYVFKSVLFKGTSSAWKTKALFEKYHPEYSI